jgi:hypothetical protein
MRTHGPRVATVVTCMAATYGMFIYYEAEILTTTLGTVLSTAAALLLLEADHRDSPRLFAAAGLALGATAITHATSLVLAPVAFAWILWKRPWDVRRGVAAAAFAGGLAVLVGGVTLRNVVVSGDPVLIASQGGINFYIGNNEQSDGKSALAPGMPEAAQVISPDGTYRDSMQVAAKTLAERELGRVLRASEISRYWYDRGFEWMTDHPKAALVHFARKVVYFWNAFEISNNRDLRDQARRFTPLLRFFLWHFAILLPLALFAILRGGMARSRWLLVGFLAVYSLAIAAFFVCARYRQPAVVWLLPFSGAGLVLLFDDLRRAAVEPRRALVSLAIVAVLAIVTNPFVIYRHISRNLDIRRVNAVRTRGSYGSRTFVRWE